MACRVEIIGEGKPLVLIHGWGMHGGVWQPIVKQLAKDYMLYIVDLPGMGYSRTADPYELYTLAAEVAEVMPGLCDVLGWSLGGLVAQHIAINQPDRIRRLILVGTTPCFINREDWDEGISPDFFTDFARSVDDDYKRTMIKFLTLQCMKAKGARDTIKQLRHGLELKPVPSARTLKQALQVLLQTDLREEVVNIHKPTLLIHGDRDNLAPVQAAHWMMQHLPKGFLRVISGAAHAPFLSHSEQFIEALDQFLEPNV